MKFSIKDFFSKCDQICEILNGKLRFLRSEDFKNSYFKLINSECIWQQSWGISMQGLPLYGRKILILLKKLLNILFSLTSAIAFDQIISEPTYTIKNSSSCIDLIFTDELNLGANSGVHALLYHQISHSTFNLISYTHNPVSFLFGTSKGLT